jgi:hypothetical protein
MKTYLLSKIPLCVMALTGATVALGALGQPSQAQPFPGRVFGCSIPGDIVRDNPFGVGSQPANALIVTADSGIPGLPPFQGSLATFSQVGTQSGQGRCVDYSSRLNALNNAVFSTWVFDVGTTRGNLPGICFRPPGRSCGDMSNRIQAGSPNDGDSYEVFPLATGQVTNYEALNRLTTNLNFMMEARNTLPIRD